MRRIALATATALLLAGTASAQMGAMPAPAGAASGAMDVAPMTGLDAPRYVQLASDANNFEIEAAKVMQKKSKRADVKGLAKQMQTDHEAMQKTLEAALKNSQRTLTKPSPKLSLDNQSKIDMLAKAPEATLDNLYLQQQIDAHKLAWSIHKGYALDGSDDTLKQVATQAAPKIEQHLASVQAMLPAAMAGPR
jgi:putative membrane protein